VCCYDDRFERKSQGSNGPSECLVLKGFKPEKGDIDLDIFDRNEETFATKPSAKRCSIVDPK